jgi:hypothetical protein
LLFVCRIDRPGSGFYAQVEAGAMRDSLVTSVMRCRWLHAVIATFLLCAVAVIGCSAAHASSFHRVDGNAEEFVTDGTRYAVWQYHPSYPLIVYDTLTGHRGEIEDGCQLPQSGGGASNGRFLVSCGGRTSLLDIKSRRLTPLPDLGGWGAVGSRYVATGYGEGLRCRGMRQHEGCLALYDIATRAVSEVPERRLPDLDRPGAPPVCTALRKPVLAETREVFSNGYSEGVLAQVIERRREGPRNWLLISRCHGRPTLLHTRSEPKSLALSEGLLTWDNGHSEDGLQQEEEEKAGLDIKRGAITTYSLSTGRRRDFPLPVLPINRNGGEPTEPDAFGVYGYSARTKNMLFWIADRSLSCGKGGCQAETHYIYAERL